LWRAAKKKGLRPELRILALFAAVNGRDSAWANFLPESTASVPQPIICFAELSCNAGQTAKATTGNSAPNPPSMAAAATPGCGEKRHTERKLVVENDLTAWNFQSRRRRGVVSG